MKEKDLENLSKAEFLVDPEIVSFSSRIEASKDASRLIEQAFSASNCSENIREIAEEINQLLKVGRQAAVIIGHRLSVIQEKELFKNEKNLDGTHLYKGIYHYAKEKFGLNRSATQTYLDLKKYWIDQKSKLNMSEKTGLEWAKTQAAIPLIKEIQKSNLSENEKDSAIKEVIKTAEDNTVKEGREKLKELKEGVFGENNMKGSEEKNHLNKIFKMIDKLRDDDDIAKVIDYATNRIKTI